MEDSNSQGGTPISLGSKELIQLAGFIRKSLRVTMKDRPVFEDVGGLLNQIKLETHHVVYGRRGSGKSSLLLSAYWWRQDQRKPACYVDAQAYRGRSYPDIIISLSLDTLREIERMVTREYSGLRRLLLKKKANRVRSHVSKVIKELETELGRPAEYVVEELVVSEEKGARGAAAGVGASGLPGLGVDASIARRDETRLTTEEKRSLQRHKLNFIENKRTEIGTVLDECLDILPGGDIFLEVDDFYFIPRAEQPLVIDYLFRLAKHRRIYLKVATIKYRSMLMREVDGQLIGVQSFADVQPIELDRTLEDKSTLSGILYRILEGLARRAGIRDPRFDPLFSPGAKELVVDASGGVPRDFLAIFLLSYDIALHERRDKRITKWAVRDAARRHLESTKRENLSVDASADAARLEEALSVVQEWALQQKKTTVFLVDKQDYDAYPETRDVIAALMDLRFLHMVAADISASYGGGHRYEGYLLDPGLWASPRRWHLNEVAYDERDTKGRRDVLRNAPAMSLRLVQESLERIDQIQS